jgi:lipopolysaccharide export system permease protein
VITKIDKYIIKKYITTFFFIVVVISMIAGVIDFSDHIDDFLESDAPISKIITQYYFNFFPFISGLMWPLYALIAVIFFTSRMAYNSEIISILNAGVSYWRLMRPYLIAATLLAGMHLFMNSTLIPLGSKAKTAFENTYLYSHNDLGKTRNVHMYISPTTKIYIKRYIKRDSLARDVMMEEFKDGKLASILSADEIRCLPEGEGKKWQLKKYYKRTFDGLREKVEEGESQDTVLNLLPEDFISYDNAKDAMTSAELQYYINRRKSRGAGGTEIYEVEYHRRWAQPATLFILTIIGMSLASRKMRGGIGFHLALGVGLGSLYIVMFQFSTTFVTNGNLPAIVGVWIPSVVFALVALYLVSKAQK